MFGLINDCVKVILKQNIVLEKFPRVSRHSNGFQDGLRELLGIQRVQMEYI